MFQDQGFLLRPVQNYPGEIIYSQKKNSRGVSARLVS